MLKKCRVWDKKDKKLLYPPFEDQDDRNIEDYIYMSYTGKDDIRGINIYDGDVIFGLLTEYDLKFTGIIYQDMNKFVVKGYPIEYLDRIEILGNAYEHPILAQRIL